MCLDPESVLRRYAAGPERAWRVFAVRENTFSDKSYGEDQDEKVRSPFTGYPWSDGWKRAELMEGEGFSCFRTMDEALQFLEAVDREAFNLFRQKWKCVFVSPVYIQGWIREGRLATSTIGYPRKAMTAQWMCI